MAVRGADQRMVGSYGRHESVSPEQRVHYRLLASLTLESEIPEEIGRLDCTEEGVDV